MINSFTHFVYSAIDAGITIFQEIGLDPGIDHLLAMNCFDEVREQGGKVGYCFCVTEG